MHIDACIHPNIYFKHEYSGFYQIVLGYSIDIVGGLDFFFLLNDMHFKICYIVLGNFFKQFWKLYQTEGKS